MSALDRRAFLSLSGAAVAASALPFAPRAAQAIAPAATTRPLPTWIVGTPGEWDHEIIRALTREAAIRLRCDDCEGEDDDDFVRPNGCECEPCLARGGYEATRVEAWDGRPVKSIGSGDWLAIGNEARCERCHYETDPENGHSVAGKAICGECMTLVDWDIVDPDYAAELRAEEEDAAPPPTATQDPDHAV